VTKINLGEWTSVAVSSKALPLCRWISDQGIHRRDHGNRLWARPLDDAPEHPRPSMKTSPRRVASVRTVFQRATNDQHTDRSPLRDKIRDVIGKGVRLFAVSAKRNRCLSVDNLTETTVRAVGIFAPPRTPDQACQGTTRFFLFWKTRKKYRRSGNRQRSTKQGRAQSGSIFGAFVNHPAAKTAWCHLSDRHQRIEKVTDVLDRRPDGSRNWLLGTWTTAVVIKLSIKDVEAQKRRRLSS